MAFFDKPANGLFQCGQFVENGLVMATDACEMFSILAQDPAGNMIPGRQVFCCCEFQKLVEDGPVPLLGRLPDPTCYSRAFDVTLVQLSASLQTKHHAPRIFIDLRWRDQAMGDSLTPVQFG
jgi:hypothetical protein